METLKTVVGYGRVSTKNQAEEGYSIDAQKQSIEEYAKKNNYKLLKIFLDEGKSATTASRPMFKEMVNYCIDNKVHACVVWHTDRFARNELLHSLFKKELLENGVELLSITQPMIDTSPEGYLLDGVLANLNAYYSRDLGRKTKKGMLRKWESGWYPGPSPLGYKNITNPADETKNIIVPDKKISPLIKEMFQLYSTGKFSIQQLIEVFSEKGMTGKNGKELSHSTIHQILDNEFYYGRMHWAGLTKVGNHKPIISKELFDTCRYIRAKHRQFSIRRRKHNFLLCSFIYCGFCGRRYTAEWHKITRSKFRDKIAYYHCTKPGGCYSKYVEKEDIERKVSDLFKKIQFTDEFIAQVEQQANDFLKTGKQDTHGMQQALINQRTGLESKVSKLLDLLIDGSIDKDTHRRKHAEITQQLDNLQAQTDNIEEEGKLDMPLVEQTLSLVKGIYQTYKNAPDPLKRLYLRFFYEAFTVDTKVISEAKPTPIFNALKTANSVRLLATQLLKRNITINSYLAHVFKVFEDFKLIAEIRKELDTLKDPVASYIPATT